MAVLIALILEICGPRVESIGFLFEKDLLASLFLRLQLKISLILYLDLVYDTRVDLRGILEHTKEDKDAYLDVLIESLFTYNPYELRDERLILDEDLCKGGIMIADDSQSQEH